MTHNVDIQHEQLVSLKEASKLLPKRNGKRMHYSTIYRWATKGARGRKLESVHLGGVLYTSVEAISRFTAPASMVDLETGQAIAHILANDGM